MTVFEEDAIVPFRMKRSLFLVFCLAWALSSVPKAVYGASEDRNFWTGRKLYDQGNYKEALPYFDEAVKLDPRDEYNYAWRGITQGKLGNVKQALEDLDLAVRLNPKEKWIYEQRAPILADSGNGQGAIADCDAAVRLKPKDAGVYRTRGDVYSRLGKYSEAIADYNFAISLEPKNGVLYNQRGNSHWLSRKYAEALEDYNQAVRLLGSKGSVQFSNRAGAYSGLGNYEAAVRDLSYAIQLEPNNAGYYENRGDAYRDWGKLKEAGADFTQAITLSPNDGSLYNKRGVIFCWQKDYKAAILDFGEAIKFSKGKVAINFSNRGYAYRLAKQDKEAIADYTEAIKLQPNRAEDYFCRGCIYYWMQRFNDALSDVDRAIKLDPQKSEYYRCRAFVYDNLDNNVSALADYAEAIRLSKGKDASLFQDRAACFKANKQYDQALADLEEATKLSPNSDRNCRERADVYFRLNKNTDVLKEGKKAVELDNKNPRNYYWRGIAYYALGDYRSALSDLGEAVRLSNGDSSHSFVAYRYYNLVRERGYCYYNLGWNPEALLDFTETIKLDPNNLRAYIGRASVYEKLGRKAEAVDDFKRALLIDPNNISARSALNKLQPGSIPLTVATAPVPAATPVAPSTVSSSTNFSGTRSGAINNAITSGINRPIADKWALVVGISDFENHDIRHLDCAAKDAEDFASFLIKEGNFTPDHVRVLLNDKARQRRIMSEVGSKFLAPAVTNRDDLVVLFFSTHGTPPECDAKGENFIVAYDTDPNDPYTTGIDMQDIMREIKRRVSSDRIVMVLDTCFSGATEAGSKSLTRAGNLDAEFIAQGTGALVICSSSPHEKSWESRRYKNSVFTRQLIDGLKQCGGRLDRAFNYTKNAVRVEVKEDQHGTSQIPYLNDKAWKGNTVVLTARPTAPRLLPQTVKGELLPDSFAHLR